MRYYLIFQRLPEELRPSMFEFADAMESHLREQLAVRRQDFDELWHSTRVGQGVAKVFGQAIDPARPDVTNLEVRR